MKKQKNGRANVMKSITIPECLKEMETFSRNEYNQVMSEKHALTEPQSNTNFKKR